MSDRTSLAAALDGFEGAEVLVVGDVMLDRFVYGSVDRISPEAPIPVFKVEGDSIMLGGSGNVVRNAVCLGANVCFITAMGEDGAADEIERMLSELGRVTEILIREKDRKTALKTRYIAGGQQMLRADDETIAPLPPHQHRRVTDAVEGFLNTARVMVLADYGKGILPPDKVPELIGFARAAGVPVIVDPQGSDYGAYGGASLVTPNRKELGEATRMPVLTPDEVEQAARELIARHGIEAVLVTLSGDGMMLVSGDRETQIYPAEAREVFDVSGAGDTVVAALATAIARNTPMDDAVQIANLAAGIVVGKIGTAVAYPAELRAALHIDGGGKLMPLESAEDRVKLWHSQGLKIGFANGVFDLLHQGHLAVIEAANRACDRLIIGLNSDLSTNILKGLSRPVQDQDTRAAVLSALSAVDMVILFDDQTPVVLIERLKPDLLIKGGDYKRQDLPEADIVEAYGGDVLLVTFKDGHSTTATVSKISGG